VSKKTDYVMEQERLPVGPTCCEGGNLGEPHECRKQQVAVVEQPGAIQRAPTLIDVFSALARDTSIDVSRIKQLMEMQAQVEAKEAERQYIAAMNRLQPRLPRIIKRGSIEMGSKGAIAFARFEDIMEAIGPLLAQEGFIPSFGSRATDKGVLVVCTLKHAAGHAESSEIALPPDAGPGRNGLQALGSALQYARRYLLAGMLNLVTVNEDDDGKGIGFIDEQQVNNIIDMFAAAEMGPDSQSKFLTFMGAERVSEIHKRDYAKAINALQAKIRKRQEAM
jgi:hypothetical protein